jgi:hypothetical protein
VAVRELGLQLYHRRALTRRLVRLVRLVHVVRRVGAAAAACRPPAPEAGGQHCRGTGMFRGSDTCREGAGGQRKEGERAGGRPAMIGKTLAQARIPKPSIVSPVWSMSARPSPSPIAMTSGTVMGLHL